nr:ROK family transcriptional regulator [uncultured Actinoplanes sp.]
MSNRDIRTANARMVLSRLWDADAITGSELIEATGLTRATVHDVCQELIELGWIEELPNQRAHGGYVKGRPARRYALAARAGVVVGVDSGDHRVIATVADLRGVVLAQRSRTFTARGNRRRTVSAAILDALAAVPIPEAAVLAVVVGVPAPVDAGGRTVITTNEFWNRVNPDLGTHLSAAHGWTAVVDNDANLAALAEGWLGHGRGSDQFVTVLTGERLGAGVVVDGHLLRGARGGAGELVWLDHLEGVGSADGIAALSRRWAAESPSPSSRPVAGSPSLTSGSPSSLAASARSAEEVFAAAAQGDPVGTAVIRRLGERFARISSAVGKVFDTELIILAGAVATACGPILEVVERELPSLAIPPYPRVVASELGEAVVALGAVRRAITYLQEHALIDVELPARVS